MPVIQSAIKKLRRDARRTQHNDMLRARLRDTMRKVRKGTIDASDAYSVVDKTVKANLIHPNKAARLKSSISKSLPNKAKKNVSVKKKGAASKSTSQKKS